MEVTSRPPHSAPLAEDPSPVVLDSSPDCYAAVVDGHPDLICRWLPDGTITYVNGSFCRFVGKTRDLLMETNLLDQIYPPDRERMTRHLARIGHHRHPASIELRMKNASGQIRWHQWVFQKLDWKNPGNDEFLSTGRDITDLKRTASTLDRYLSRMTRLNDLAQTYLTVDNLDQLLRIAVTSIPGILAGDTCTIYVWDEDKRQVTLTINKNLRHEIAFEAASLPEDSELVQLIMETAAVREFETMETLPLLKCDERSACRIRRVLALPIVAGDQKLGAILVGYTSPSSDTIAESSLAQQAAAQIAQTMTKIRMIEQSDRTAQEAATLFTASAIVAANLEPDLAIDSILDQLEKVVPFDSASVQLLSGQYLEIKSGKGWAEGHNPVGAKFRVPGNNPNSKVILSGEPVILNDAPDQYAIFSEPPHLSIRSWLGVPLKVRNTVMGMLTLDHHQPNFYDNPRTIDLVCAFADQVAISLETARLFASERQRARELESLRATTTDLTRELSLDKLLNAILGRAIDLLNASGGELALLDSETSAIIIHASQGMGATNIGAHLQPGAGLMGYVAETRKIEMIEDYKHWEHRQDSYHHSAIHAAIAAPLIIGKRFLGVIGVMNSDRKRKFSQSEHSLMTMFAQQAAIAVQNAQRFEQRETQARTDAATGVYNRWGLNEAGTQEITRARRYQRPLAALMLDIDHFKSVNDTYGHGVGDMILRELCDRLRNNLRSMDILGRYGGEEFLILLPETTAADAQKVGKRLVAIVNGCPFPADGIQLPITISVGIAGTDNTDKHVSLKDLIDMADAALYKAKQGGRNQVSVG